MEECEALCNRLVIMVKGQLVCVGASQELKQRFGAGYDIHIKLNPGRSDSDVSSIKRIMRTTLTCDIRDENLVIITLYLEALQHCLLYSRSVSSLLISICLFIGFTCLPCN